MTLVSIKTTAVLLTLLALLGAVGAATAVPDARITIDAVNISASDPAVGERTALNVTISNSAGSPAAANVTSVRLLDASGGDDTPRDEATAVGALSAGDATDAVLWTRFDEPGEHRLTVEVVAEPEATDDDADDVDPVTVTRDVVVDVQPSDVTVAVRTRALSPADLQPEGDGDPGGGLDVGNIEGIFGGDGGGLDADDDTEEAVRSAQSPVEVTVVNTGTTTADRVSLTAVGTAVESDDEGEEVDHEGDEVDHEGEEVDHETTVDAGPFVVSDVAPGEERRVVVDLGPLDRRSNVTLTATFRSGTDAQDGLGANRTADSTVVYPPREAIPTITDATVRTSGDEAVVVDANLGNAGTEEMEGIVVSVAESPGVSPTPGGGEYFAGTLGESDFVGFDLRTTANVTVADEAVVRIEYTERGVRYTETRPVALPDADENDGDSVGTLGSLGEVVAVVGLVGAVGLAVVGGVLRRRDV